ncbi:RWD domain-containing protein 2B [Venturia canescens]|uniref:RWD domain-containing protein 2B n=1 Tax=Venturia canescens TaxID=32260 RepID=UPI001C9CBBE4|nr:RWD domain-containing protein 2B [Venturia canescens]
MSTLNEIREKVEAQLCELEALQSVYPKELTIADHGNLADLNEFVSGKRAAPPLRLEYTIEITTPEGSAELQVNLPFKYPEERPEIYVRSSCLDRIQQTRMNEDLKTFVDLQEIDEPCIYSLVTWTQDYFEGYVRNSQKRLKKNNGLTKKTEENRKMPIFARYWIYSHHIYSNLKRKDIADEAKENSLTGFCLAGKPGIICVEGAKDDCEYWWQKIKVMNWHKILVKLIEDEDMFDNNLENYRKFSEFQEISFPTTDKHNDMGQLLKYLTEHGCQYVFKELFGVEGKIAVSTE